MQPTGKTFALAKRVSLADEHKKSGLQYLLRQVLIGHPAAAQTQKKRPMALNNGLEGGLLAVVQEAIEQFAIRATSEGVYLELPKESGHRIWRHDEPIVERPNRALPI